MGWERFVSIWLVGEVLIGLDEVEMIGVWYSVWYCVRYGMVLTL